MLVYESGGSKFVHKLFSLHDNSLRIATRDLDKEVKKSILKGGKANKTEERFPGHLKRVGVIQNPNNPTMGKRELFSFKNILEES